ncbi:MAG: glycosyltransferase family 4 protein, partial [Woeseiaceae bacterium]
NILAAAEALAENADVTVAFRSFVEAPESDKFQTIEIEPTNNGQSARDDVAARGLNPVTHLRYLKRLREFSSSVAGKYDLVLEKGWRLSGYLCRELGKHGVPAMLIENDVRIWTDKLNSVRNLARFAVHSAAQRVARNASQDAPRVIAETEQLREALLDCRGLAPEKVRVVSLGVDHSIFRPMDKETARQSLGIDEAATIFLYVGGMDQYHDLSPLLKALRKQPVDGLEIHLVGDGSYRPRYEALGQGLTNPVRFHGQVPHSEVPRFIAAADACVAPYDADGFYHKQVSFATLKIPEYMACAKPVISIPSGHILSLIDHGNTGFLFDNNTAAWGGFLGQLPDRTMLNSMGQSAATTVREMTWQSTARQYLEIGSEITDKSL